MLETLERPRSPEHTAPAPAEAPRRKEIPAQSRAQPPSPPESYVEMDDGLLRDAGPIMIGCYAIAFASTVVTFMGNGEALINIVISIGFAVMFFSLPLLFMQVRARHDARWKPTDRNRRSDMVDTYTGPMDRTSAVIHMVIVPITVVIAFCGFGIIWTLVRP